MKKIIILSLAFCAIALLPQAVSAQTQPTAPKKDKAVISTTKGDVVPIKPAKGAKPRTGVVNKPISDKPNAAKQDQLKMMKMKQVGKTKSKTVPMIVTPSSKGEKKQTKLIKDKKLEKQ